MESIELIVGNKIVAVEVAWLLLIIAIVMNVPVATNVGRDSMVPSAEEASSFWTLFASRRRVTVQASV